MSNYHTTETSSFNHNNNQSPESSHQFVSYSRTNPSLYNSNNPAAVVPMGSDASETFSTGSMPSGFAQTATNHVGVPQLHQSMQQQQQPVDSSIDRSSSVNLPSHFSVAAEGTWSRGGSGNNLSQPTHQQMQQSTNSMDMWGKHVTYPQPPSASVAVGGGVATSGSSYLVGADPKLASFSQAFTSQNHQQYVPLQQQTPSTTGLTPSSPDGSLNHFRAPPAYQEDSSLSLMRGARSREESAPLYGISLTSTDGSSPGAFMGNSVSTPHLSYNSGASHPSATPTFSAAASDHNLMLQAHYQQQQQQFVTNANQGYQSFVYTSPQGQHMHHHPHHIVPDTVDGSMYGRNIQSAKNNNNATTTTSSKKRKATGQSCPPFDLPSTLRKLIPHFEHIDGELSEADVAPLQDVDSALLESEGVPPSVYPPALDRVNSSTLTDDNGEVQQAQETAAPTNGVAAGVAKPRGAKRNAGTFMDMPLLPNSPIIPLRTARFYAPDFTRVFEMPLHHLHCTQGLVNHLVDVSIKGPAASRSRLLICEHVYNSSLKPWLEFIDASGGSSSGNALLKSFRRTISHVRQSLQDDNRGKLPEEKAVDFPTAPAHWSKAGDEQPAEVYAYARALAELYGKLNRSMWCPLGSKCPDLHPHFIGLSPSDDAPSSSADNNIISSMTPDNSCSPSDLSPESSPIIANTAQKETTITTTLTSPTFAPHPALAWSTVHANTHPAEAHMCFTTGFDVPIAAPNELCASEKIPSEKVFMTKGALEFFETTLCPADSTLPPLPPLAHLVISSGASADVAPQQQQQQDDDTTKNNITNATTTAAAQSQVTVRSVLQHCAHFSKNGICALGAECLFVHAVGYSCPSQPATTTKSADIKSEAKSSPSLVAPPGAALRVPSSESNTRNDVSQQQQRASRKVHPGASTSQPQFVTSVPTTAYYSAPPVRQQHQAVYARGVPVFQQPQYPRHHQPTTTNTPSVNTTMNFDYNNIHNGGFGQQQMNNPHGGDGGASAWSYMQHSIQTQQQQQQHIGHHNAPAGMSNYANNSMFPNHHHAQHQQQQPSFGGAVGGGVGGAHLGMWPGHPH